MNKLFIILLLLNLKLSATANSTFDKVFYFKINSKGVSRVEKIFSADSAILQQPDKEIVQHFEGWLKSTAMEKWGDVTICEATINTIKYGLSDEDGQALSLPFNPQELEMIFYYSIASTNKIIDIKFQPEVTNAAKKIIKELIAYLQYSYKNKTSNKWQVIEDDPSGHAKVAYKLMSINKNSTSVKRTVLNYFAEKNEINNNFLTSTYLPDGNTIIEFSGKDNSLLKVKGWQKITTQLNNKIAGVAEQTIYLVDSSNNLMHNDLLALKYRLYQRLKKNLQTTALYNYVSPQQILIDNRKITLGNDNYQTISSMFSTANVVGTDSLYFKLRALCTVYPSYAKQFVAMLDTAAAGSAVYENIWQALLHTGNSESVHALCSILINHKNDWLWLKNIIGNLGLVKNCTDTLWHTFQQLYISSNNIKIKNTLELAMGTMVDNLSSIDSYKSNQLYKWVLQKLDDKPVSDKNNIQKILVLGNTNTKAAKKNIEHYVTSSNEEVKRVAIHQLENFKLKQ